MSSARALGLGAFELVEPLRRGGMAEVWRGVHAKERTPVAIKLVTATHAFTRELREALQNEVRAMARLEHPGIVRVHDYGEVPAEIAEASNGTLAAGSPYLVMELAEGGTLKGQHVRSFEDMRGVLGALLASLAHAHARGVVHRDIKPSNVLVTSPEVLFKLADFGIAHALSVRAQGEATLPLSAGTASFMAPEQILGLYRDEGPWTDLYALGCLAHLLATGRFPFRGPDRDAVYRAHCFSAPPRLEPRFAVPSDLEAWILVLLSKRPRDRFALAADALQALLGLNGDAIAAASAAPRPAAATWTGESGETPIDAPTETVHVAGVHLAVPSQLGVFELADGLRHVIAQPVREAPIEAREQSSLLTGIGLGVYGLRPVPLAGRDGERRALWSLLREAWERGAPRVVEIRGRAGLGKTRLAEWLSERASETGTADALWAALGPTPTLSEGLSRMILRHLRLEGLSHDSIAERLFEHPTEPALTELDGAERARLTDMLAPSGGARSATRPEERFAVATRFFAAIGARRPVIAVFDDAQFGRDAIAFAEHLLKLRAARLPVLVVLTVQEEALEKLPEVGALLDALSEHGHAERIVLRALGEGEHAQLVHSMLGLEERLARDIAKRTSGNPLFAIQLVGDWVERGDLVAGAQGFSLREGASLDLPDDIHDLWNGRVERFLEALAPDLREQAAIALELAALLGRRVDMTEWGAACRAAGAEVQEGLLDTLAQQRLALVGRARFSFVHGMLAESLSRRAREAGRWTELHRACATALSSAEASRGQAERIGRHFAAAGEAALAAPLLFEAANERLLICDFAEVHAIVSLLDEGLARAGVAESDPRRGMASVVHAEAAVAQGRLDECSRWMEGAAKAAADARVEAELCQLRGRLALKRAENDASARHYEESLARMRALGDRARVAHALHGLGEAEKLLGRLDESLLHQEEAARLFDEVGAAVDAARARMGIADVLRRKGELVKAISILEDTVAIVRRLSNGHCIAVGLNTLGDIERQRGRLEEAEGFYRESLAELEALASEETIFIRLNLGLAQLARDRWADARQTFDAGRRDLDQEGRRGYLAFVLAALWVCDAGEARWDAFDARADETPALLREVLVVDDDLAWCLERAGRVALTAGEAVRARVPLALALEQWRALARADKASAVEALLDEARV